MKLNACRIGILTTDGFDAIALDAIRDELRLEGAEVRLLSLAERRIKGWSQDGWDSDEHVDMVLDEVVRTDFDMLVIPPGLIAVDALKGERFAINFLKRFHAGGRIVAASGHAPILLSEAGLARGLTATGAKSIRTDLRNAGAFVRENGPRCDRRIVTAASNRELPDFVAAMTDQFLAQERQLETV
ncbi:DJ-1/PfpI family protein [Notoacmeibacter sp. MSK16QG-6]|uniref:DJ-1/PfpI family protein n=1 Tax=Notoacmeibacter sp. MSK16QG-6 TaxID=2957982 RepID=UPI00209CE3BA|nr:DJ-1/PfpI family protein [Notoacmeibacter sp. MSK16QG-6]MCP1198824.1 DJ-1/PfpI family protein [Notoacmeibacter sp. MSK16QG-6]